MKYAIVIEEGENNYSAYVPDLPGCVSTGKTLEEVKKNMEEAIEFHLEGLKQELIENYNLIFLKILSKTFSKAQGQKC